jgi:hypothetical protein
MPPLLLLLRLLPPPLLLSLLPLLLPPKFRSPELPVPRSELTLDELDDPILLSPDDRLSELRPVIIARSLLEPRSSDEDSRFRMRSPLVRSPLLMRSLSSAVSREPSAGSILDLRFWSM